MKFPVTTNPAQGVGGIWAHSSLQFFSKSLMFGVLHKLLFRPTTFLLD